MIGSPKRLRRGGSDDAQPGTTDWTASSTDRASRIVGSTTLSTWRTAVGMSVCAKRLTYFSAPRSGDEIASSLLRRIDDRPERVSVLDLDDVALHAERFGPALRLSQETGCLFHAVLAQGCLRVCEIHWRGI